jgi:hypothetical protein
VRGTLLDPAISGLSGRYPTGQRIIPFEARGSPQRGLAYLSRCNSDWFCHSHIPPKLHSQFFSILSRLRRPERRAGSPLHRRRSVSPSSCCSAPSWPSSRLPPALHYAWKLPSHFFALFLHSGRRNAAVAIPQFKPARDPIADLLFFLGSSLQNIRTPPSIQISQL